MHSEPSPPPPVGGSYHLILTARGVVPDQLLPAGGLRSDHRPYTNLLEKVERALATTAGPRPFADPRVAAVLVERLQRLSGARCRVLAYSLLPDHLQLLVHFTLPPPGGPAIRTVAAVDAQLTRTVDRLRAPVAGFTGPDWSAGYYRRRLRDLPRLRAAHAYVLRRPVEAGLVTDWREHPWTGGEELSGGAGEFIFSGPP